jgi:hypothetical protein
MWNKWLAIWREPSSKRLAVALLVSVVLHAWLFGGLHLSLPAQKESTVIEARLQLPERPKKIVEETPKPAQTTPAKPRPKPVKPHPVAAPEPAPTAAPVAMEPVPVAENVQPPSDEVVQAEQDTPQVEQPQTDEGLMINEHPYEYIETYFDIRTKIDGPVEGKAKSTFNAEGEQYRLDFIAEPGGMAGLLLPNLIQVSQGVIVKTGLQPLIYTYQFGTRADKSRRATFDWEKKSLEIMTSKETTAVPLMEGAQDVISFMYQFMYVAPLQNMQLNITNGKSFKEYDYEFMGEETLNLSFGEVQAYHIVHNNTDNDEKVELWLAQDYQFIPVKIRKIDKEGKVYEFTATRIETSRPSRER